MLCSVSSRSVFRCVARKLSGLRRSVEKSSRRTRRFGRTPWSTSSYFGPIERRVSSCNWGIAERANFRSFGGIMSGMTLSRDRETRLCDARRMADMSRHTRPGEKLDGCVIVTNSQRRRKSCRGRSSSTWMKSLKLLRKGLPTETVPRRSCAASTLQRIRHVLDKRERVWRSRKATMC